MSAKATTGKRPVQALVEDEMKKANGDAQHWQTAPATEAAIEEINSAANKEEEMATGKPQDKPQFAVTLSATNLTLILTLIVLAVTLAISLTHYQDKIDSAEKEIEALKIWKQSQAEARINQQNEIDNMKIQVQDAREAARRAEAAKDYQVGFNAGKKGPK